ncbi:MAG: thioredoxin-dependent thiol peroxidase [Pseudomonadales bacterium]|nr:thioredoxin-dependent thiol peroxidase [Pseudomonadales bacterium]NRA14369.1 thioredoxin-dependent thiol peroxidase [Oceanospirillaceae bacterium]
MTLSVGDTAPGFNCKNQAGEEISLSALQGKKVILYFYPKDSTPGCTVQACNLRDNFDTLTTGGYVVLGVSSCSEKRHNNFIEKNNLPFDLLLDPEQQLQNLYGVWQLKKTFGKEYMGTVRTTFVIDEQGLIVQIINKVKTKEHWQQIGQ